MMTINGEHKKILKGMGLKEEDLKLFDGKYVKYEYDEMKGVRIYDPYYKTSYNEYIDVDGWSAWSLEEDTFMSDILKGAREEAKRREEMSPQPSHEDMAQSLEGKFGKKTTPDSE